MDFDKFLEKDIIEFLDEQTMLIAEKVAGIREEEFDLYEITQDYSKEINEALKDRDLRKARKVFEEVKNNYLNAPENSLSKKRFYIIMEEIYERIKDYEAKEEGKKSLFETIKEYEVKGLFSRPDLFEEKRTQHINLILRTIARKDKEIEILLSKRPIKEDDLKDAIKKYREVKELIRRMPNAYAKEKSKAYESALSWYYTIKKLKLELGKKKEEKKLKKSAPEVPVENKLEKVRTLKQELINSHNRIAEHLKNRELKKSIAEYRHLKQLCESFPQEMEEEKTALLADALSLYESIKKLKNQLVQRHGREFVEKQEAKAEEEHRKAKKAEIKKELGIIKEMLEKKDAVNAINEYKKAKELFRQFPDHPPDEKKELYDEIIAEHKDIQMLEDDLRKKNPAYEDKKISDIIQRLEDIHDLINKGKIEDATHLLLEAKHKTQMLSKDSFDEKYKLVKEVEKLEQKLLFVKNIDTIYAPNIKSNTP